MSHPFLPPPDRARPTILTAYDAHEHSRTALLELVGVLDSFDRVLAAGPDPDPAGAHERLRLLGAQLRGYTDTLGLEVVTATAGEDYEPALHEVVEERAAPGARADEVLETLRPGYRFGRRLVRPAQVAVAADAAAARTPAAPDSPETPDIPATPDTPGHAPQEQQR
ncbi:nucleotide exchange factor GrpE [Streptomyces polyrhachis]|uniref:Nucleotide exchange factor GrpE n=1 Tax=Streptomyces polyrhachis TaxID=1282885 RepID=A0ABW2GI61_9ACTN